MIFTSTNIHKTYEKLNPNESIKSAAVLLPSASAAAVSDPEPVRMGVAVPLSPEDYEREMNVTHAQKVSGDTSTQKEGISTWILLSGASSTKEPQHDRTSYRYEAKVEKVQKINDKPQNRRTTVKPKEKLSTTIATTTTTTTTKPTKVTKTPSTIHAHVLDKIEIKDMDKNSPIRQKKPSSEGRPVLVTKKAIKKSTIAVPRSTTPPPPPPSSTTSTSVETSTEALATSRVSTSTAETTTFLILEPKDADFDLPQDRSPGHTTKKPKRNNTNKNTKTKKNKNKTDVEKKPTKPNPVKDKPLSTKIYNYLAREVMPTVGVGLVGLVVTAGLATYFLGPFGALRRSYDVADRKDDVYFYNNEEYAGPDGHSEEEVFGKVIAGMPANSPYRNSIKYTPYHGGQNNQNGQTHRPVRYDLQQHPPQSPQYNNRYRNTGYGSGYQAQPPHPVYNNPKPQESYSPTAAQQHFYRYNSDGTAYRANTEDNIKSTNNKKTSELENEIKEHIGDLMETTPGPSIVTPQTFPATIIPDQSIEDNNVLRRRSQFVVGSIESVQQQQQQPSASQSLTDHQLTVDSVPEHGPRRRRRNIPEFDKLRNGVDDEDNEIEGINPIRNEINKISSTHGPKIDDVNKDSIVVPESIGEPITTDTSPGITEGTKQNIFDLIRNVFEIKVRMGLSFLQSTTEAFQRYLKRVEKRVDESKIFSKYSH